MIKHKLSGKAVLAVMCAALAFSCIKDHEADMQGVSGGEKNVLLSIEVPGAVNGTRALADDDAECTVSFVDVLQFDAAGRYAYRAEGRGITGAGTTRSFEATLLKGTYSLVIVANARQQVNDAVNGTNGVTQLVAGSTLRQDALDRLNMTVAATVKLTSGGVMPALPMFGYVAPVGVQEGLSLTGANTVPMVRSVAKMEVFLTTKAASGTDGGTGNANFRLADARLYNQPLKGWVVPNIASWPSDNIAVAPYYGGGSAPTKAVYPTNAPIVCTGAADNVTDNDILRSIYTFEAPAGVATKPGRFENTCLVIGGYYKGSSTVSYYRVDIRHLAGDGTETYLPIMRNHSYNVNIKSVTGIGYPTPDDAFYGEIIPMEVDVVPWNEAAQNVIADGQYKLKVSGSSFLYDYSGGHDDISVETDYDPAQTQGFPAGLRIDDTEIVYTGGTGWITMNTGGSNGDMARTISLDVAQNLTGTDRSAKLYVRAGNMTKVINVTQPAIHLAPINTYTYAGAFWKADQTGERLISIPINTAAVGKWSARVYYYGDFGNDDILFSTAASMDPNIYTDTTADMNTYDATYPVENGQTYLTGTVKNGDKMFFRLGLNSKWSDNGSYHTDNRPARYAVVIISYNNYKKHQKIYLRQGHEADYLMRPGDAGALVGGRTLAVKVSPYNLTAPEYRDNSSSAHYITLTARNGAFTYYPSQAGALFQWAQVSTRAYHPTIPTSAPTGWVSTQTVSGYWGNIKSTYETCPTGYRRPTEGSATNTGAVTAGSDPRNQEYGQSMYLNPVDGYGVAKAVGNLDWGYYADGFFDRRPIGTPQNIVTYDSNSVVAYNTSTVAYIGALLFNPYNNASIFIPAAGWRDVVTGSLDASGAQSYIWTATSTQSNWATFLVLNRGLASYHGPADRSHGISIRCVKE